MQPGMQLFIFRVAVWLVVWSFCIGTAGAAEVRGLKAQASSWKLWGAPELLVDGDVKTAWVGGLKGVGPGKMLTVDLPHEQAISRLRIANGNQGAEKFELFCCIKRGVLVLPDHGVHYFTLKAEPGEQDVVFPPATVSSFVLVIDEVFMPVGSLLPEDAKVAVSEIRVFNDATPSATTTAKPQARAARTASAVSAGAVAAHTGQGPIKPQTHMLAATKPGRRYMQALVPSDDPGQGAIQKDVPPAFVDLVRAYFERLAVLDTTYIDLFVPEISRREQAALLHLEQTLRRTGRLSVHLGGAPDTSGLGIGKPIVRGDSAMVHVYGLFGLESEGKRYAAPVDAFFSFALKDGVWRINGVREK